MKKTICLLLLTAAIGMVAPAALAQETPFVDVGVLKNGPADAVADSDVPYDISVTNFGDLDATTVTLTDPVPSGMTFVSATQNTGPALSCGESSGVVTCSGAALAAGETATFTFVFHIPAGTPNGTTFLNTATVSAPGDQFSENDQSSVGTSTPPPPYADLAVTKNGPSAAGPDTDVTYTIFLVNAGPNAATTVSLTDTLPGTMTFVSLSQSGTALSCTTPPVGSGGTITCTAATYPNGANTTLTLVAHIPSGTQPGTAFANTATVTSDLDPTPENNSSTASLTTSAVDMAVVKSGPASVTAGNTIVYTIVVSNAGPDGAPNVQLTDPLPTGTTFVSFTQDNGPAASCSAPSVGFNGIINCVWGVGFGVTSAQFTLTVNSGATVSDTNTATVQSDAFDTNPNNNTSSVTTTVTQSADVSVTKSGPGTITAGQNITYTIAVANNGASNAANVTLTDTPPAGTSLVSVTQNTGPAFTCGAGPSVSCSIGTLTAGSTATFTVVMHVASSVANGSTISNTANVSSTTADPNPSNNSSNTTATVATSADVAVTKNGPAAVTTGSNVTYTVTVANSGPSDAQNVSLTDTIPAGTTFVSANQTSGPTFTCTTGATITCTIATLVSGASASFDFSVAVSPLATGTLTNTANVTSTTSDPNAANNTSTSSAPISAGPSDLAITKTVQFGRFAPGTNATFNITVTNNGPGNATGVTVTDPLPFGTTYVSATPSQGTCTGGPTVTCSLGTLAPSASATIALVVTLPPNGGQISNTATVTSTNGETNPANNASTATVQVTADIPAVSPLGMMLLAVALAVAAAVVLKR